MLFYLLEYFCIVKVILMQYLISPLINMGWSMANVFKLESSAAAMSCRPLAVGGALASCGE